MPITDLPLYLDTAILPIGRWHGEPLRPFSATSSSKFSAADSSTFRTLQRELDHLDAEDRVLYVCVPAEQFRRDGRPARNATVTAPGVVLEFTADGQTFEYVADRFRSQMENLRAIALTLEHLRAVDRYGLTGDRQQYRGFLAIEAPAAADGFTTAHGALEWLNDRFGEPGTVHTARELIRRAQRAAHPDRGGDAATFQRVAASEATLREAGML